METFSSPNTDSGGFDGYDGSDNFDYGAAEGFSLNSFNSTDNSPDYFPEPWVAEANLAGVSKDYSAPNFIPREWTRDNNFPDTFPAEWVEAVNDPMIAHYYSVGDTFPESWVHTSESENIDYSVPDTFPESWLYPERLREVDPYLVEEINRIGAGLLEREVNLVTQPVEQYSGYQAEFGQAALISDEGVRPKESTGPPSWPPIDDEGWWRDRPDKPESEDYLALKIERESGYLLVNWNEAIEEYQFSWVGDREQPPSLFRSIEHEFTARGWQVSNRMGDLCVSREKNPRDDRHVINTTEDAVQVIDVYGPDYVIYGPEMEPSATSWN